MKRPGFFEGVGLGLIASFVGTIFLFALNLVLDTETALSLLIALMSLVYTAYLLIRSGERVGRLTAILVWFVAAGAAWIFAPGLPLYLLFHLGLIWLVRSLYFHASLLAALADLGLNGLALATALWAAQRTGSVFMSLWCFFLVQALFTAIPCLKRQPGKPALHSPQGLDAFQHAHRAAETALRRLSSLT